MLQTQTTPATPAPNGGATSTLRRALVAAGDRQATTQDQVDCADLLLASGFPDAARMLYELAFLRTGFGSGFHAAQRATAAHTGLWDPIDVPMVAPVARSMIAQAVAELEQLVALPLDPVASRLPLPTGGLMADVLGPPSPAAPDIVVPDLDGRAFGILSTRLFRSLAGGDVDALAPVLESIRTDMLDASEYRLAAHFNAALDDLAAMVAFNGMRRFFRTNAALGWAPFGSPTLLSAAARLHDGGMGAYFGNMPRLIRSSRDLFGLLSLVGLQARGAGEEAVERWCVLLSAHLDAHDRVTLVDDLGDLGLMRAVAGLLDHAVRNPRRDDYLCWAIRDAALDNGEPALAAAAQAMIVTLSRGSGELVVLADILAGADAIPEAEAALERALAIAPHDRNAAARLEALRENRFEAYRVQRGFGSFPLRSAMRMRNRAERVTAAEDQPTA